MKIKIPQRGQKIKLLFFIFYYQSSINLKTDGRYFRRKKVPSNGVHHSRGSPSFSIVANMLLCPHICDLKSARRERPKQLNCRNANINDDYAAERNAHFLKINVLKAARRLKCKPKWEHSRLELQSRAHGHGKRSQNENCFSISRNTTWEWKYKWCLKENKVLLPQRMRDCYWWRLVCNC